jgi:hypothetical protein
VPQEIRNSVQLCDAKESFEGFRYLECRAAVKEDVILSDEKEFTPIFLGKPVDERADDDVILAVRKSGVVNAVRFEMACKVTDGIVLEQETPFLILPTVVFLKKPVDAKKGERYLLKLRFKWGCNPMAVTLELARA